MLYKKIALILLLVHLSGLVSAQSDKAKTIDSIPVFSNRVQLCLGKYYMKGNNNNELILQFGIHYQRKISRNLGLGAGYSQWEAFSGSIFGRHVTEVSLPYVPKIGVLEDRFNYKMFDVYGIYYIHLFKRHYLNLGIGASYTWGINSYLDWYYINPDGRDMLSLYKDKKASYWGMIPHISYDLLIVNNRINVGMDARARYYAGLKRNQYDVSIHVGVNF